VTMVIGDVVKDDDAMSDGDAANQSVAIDYDNYTDDEDLQISSILANSVGLMPAMETAVMQMVIAWLEVGLSIP